jgi:hypothetical protein
VSVMDIQRAEEVRPAMPVGGSDRSAGVVL